MELNKKQSSFEELINSIYKTHYQLQDNAQKSVNLSLTLRNWLVGYYIVEYEQKGEDRARYGDKLLIEMANTLKIKGIKGLRERELHTCKRFYILYPRFLLTVSAKIQSIKTNENNYAFSILRTASAESGEKPEISPEILLSKLSYSHFIELIRIGDDLELKKNSAALIFFNSKEK